MIIEIEGIVLQTIRHTDKNNIVTLYTRERGRVTFISPIGKTKTGRARNARLGLLSVVSSNVNFKENQELQYLGTLETPIHWKNLYFDPRKSSIAFFIAEFLNKILRANQGDATLWNYILSSIHHLDVSKREIANFHIVFLFNLLPFIGIEPDLAEYCPGMYFNMQTAELIYPQSASEIKTFQANPNILDSDETRQLHLLSRMNFRNYRLYRFNVGDRRKVLSKMMRYYSLHLPISTDFKSLDVLQTLFE